MSSLKFIKWSSSILLVVSVLWLLIVGTMAIFNDGIEVTDVTKMGGIIILFVGPEKAAAFFGPVIKRRQNGRDA